jgi:aryl-alcohol dehydrogenase-like predicted oxidoreductase
MRALDDLVSQGLVRYLGASNWMAWRLSKALGICEQARLEPASPRPRPTTASPPARSSASWSPCCIDEGVGILAWSPLDGGFLTGKFPRDGTMVAGTRQSQLQGYPPVNKERAWDCVDVMREIAAELGGGVTIPQVAIAWVMARPGITSVLLGARKLDQLVDTLGAVSVALSRGAHGAARRGERAAKSEYPEWMLTRQAPQRLPEPFDPKG